MVRGCVVSPMAVGRSAMPLVVGGFRSMWGSGVRVARRDARVRVPWREGGVRVPRGDGAV